MTDLFFPYIFLADWHINWIAQLNSAHLVTRCSHILLSKLKLNRTNSSNVKHFNQWLPFSHKPVLIRAVRIKPQFQSQMIDELMKMNEFIQNRFSNSFLWLKFKYLKKSVYLHYSITSSANQVKFRIFFSNIRFLDASAGRCSDLSARSRVFDSSGSVADQTGTDWTWWNRARKPQIHHQKCHWPRCMWTLLHLIIKFQFKLASISIWIRCTGSLKRMISPFASALDRINE